MSVFPLPEINDFFDERLIISWKLTQPLHLPPLKNILIEISADPQLIFDPLQDPKLNIAELNNSDYIINWVIRKPKTKTEVTLSIQNDIISEKHCLHINPKTFPQTV
ncbi:MAG: hypothetical protein JSW11_22245 [Candidatus Heimdallarchaeota archaeon]|nr:MAG: hypothetical protein JSW11_22245 [Candidatus Heimdallarchaeota archaeon]